MTKARARRQLLAVALLAAAASLACHGRMVRRHHGFSDDRMSIPVVSGVVGNKNVFLPSTIVVTAGKGRRLSIYNTTEGPHGFQIAALGVEVVLMPQEEHTLELPPLKAGHIYDIGCHLHGAHRHATLVVLPAR